MKNKAFHQNDLDGLCGMMACINSAKLLYPDIIPHDTEANPLTQCLLEHVAHSITATRFRKIWLDGCEAEHVLGFLKSITEFGIKLKVKHLPLRDRDITKIKETLSEALLEPHTCVIIGFESPYGHWSVIRSMDDEKITFFDSSYLTTLRLNEIMVGNVSEDDKHAFLPENVFIIKRG